MKTGYLVALLIVFLSACKQQAKVEPTTTTTAGTVTDTTTAKPSTPATVAPTASTFDINSVPVSDKLTGTFPYFKLPGGYVFLDPDSYRGSGQTKDYDKEYFYVHGQYWPVEGKTFKSQIRVDENAKDKVFSKLEIQKSFDDLIQQMGGVKLNSGDKLKEGEDQKLEADAFANGYLHSCHNYEDVHTYVIRKSDKAVWIQYNLGTDNTDITVLETKPFKNEMSILPASEIKQQLDAQGKAILYINFDTDKATLKGDGNDAVNEISKLLKENPTLKLSIEGYTDNTGTPQHNKQLSMDRAQTVLNSLVSKGINGANLKAVGYGSDKPLADNTSEENKAKNRRVELVKI